MPGFEEFLEVMTKGAIQSANDSSLGMDRVFDPEDIDLPTINARVGKLARRRTLGKAGYAKSKGSAH